MTLSSRPLLDVSYPMTLIVTTIHMTINIWCIPPKKTDIAAVFPIENCYCLV